MEESNGLERSEVWHKIHDIVKQIPRKEVNCDAVDAPSAATMIEELFLKLLPIHDVSNRREQLIAFANYLYECDTTRRTSEQLVDGFLESN